MLARHLVIRSASLCLLMSLSSIALIVSHQSAAAHEPFGAEDKGAEDNVPLIPEPMVFDMVRGLGAQRGECEVNVLSAFLMSDSDGAAPGGFDPFGFMPASPDTDGTEWAPEIEYALWDGFAVEFELPFENSTLEAYKFAAQWTFGTRLKNRFIDGAQVIIEPDTDFEIWELTFLYLAGIEFNEYWSAMAMIGVRPEIEEGIGFEQSDGILNFTLFRDVSAHTTLGLESNFTFGERERTTFLLVPQMDHEITDHVQLQSGIGVGFSVEDTETLAILRLIYSG